MPRTDTTTPAPRNLRTPTLSEALQSLHVARGLISTGAVSLEVVIDRNENRGDTGEITAEVALGISLEQQAEFIIGQLAHAIAQIRKAQGIAEELNAPVAAERARAA